jgi:hypothetical protein
MDELTQLLLARVAGGDEQPDGPALADVVEQSLGDDPIAAPLAAALRQREARAAETDDDTGAGVAIDDPEVTDVLERLYAELEALRGRTRTLADALGACPRCFGEDELCPLCRGRGRPGGRVPDADLYRELVEPAWRRQAGIRGRLWITDGEGQPTDN